MKFNKIHEKIYTLRKENELSQKEFAKIFGVTDKAVSKWENGVSLPDVYKIYKICKHFHIDFEDFFEEQTKSRECVKKSSMQSIKQLYKVGRGPSSSHTIGPEKICKMTQKLNPDATEFKVYLYGSLAQTGRGHGTDTVIKKTFAPKPVKIEFDYIKTDLKHPNTMEVVSYKDGKEIDRRMAYSVGGGTVSVDGIEIIEDKNVYNLSSFEEISEYCKKNDIRIWEYVLEQEGQDIFEFLKKIWKQMKDCINSGLNAEGELPGGLKVQRRAKQMFKQNHIDETPETKQNRIVCSYAFACGEQNASGEEIVTAPTCGACGVLPAVLYYYQQQKGFSDEDVLKALATASIVGNLVKTNASISGAECGCQAEIGTACSMAAAGLAELLGMSIEQIEYAAEIAIEHHLGLTCDPIFGLVQIPCIERNAVAAMRAINAVNLANFLTDTRKISLDLIIQTMYETGKDLSNKYRETSTGGLAKLYE